MRIPDDKSTPPMLPLRFSPLSDAEVDALLRMPGRLSLDDEVRVARHYHARVVNNREGKRKDLALAEELHVRLEQMNFLLKSVALLLGEYSDRSFADKPREDPRNQLWFMMFLYAESFYYFAHRVQDILDGEGLPHVTGFKRSRMITLIRNHLIEHPYRRYKDFGGRHGAMSSHDGPIMLVTGQGVPPKKLRPHQDRGLFPNARELRDLVRPVLTRALESMGGPVPPRRG